MTKTAPRLMLLLMSSLRARTTGVRGAVIWVSAGEFYSADIHIGPRIKVMPGTKIKREGLEDAVSVVLTEPPQVIGELPARIDEQAVDFAKLNREILLRYWRNEVSTREMIEGLTRS